MQFFKHLFHTTILFYYKHTQIQHYMITGHHVNFINWQEEW